MSYPIVDQETLTIVGKRGLFSLRGRERAPGQVPSPLPHQAVVVSDGISHTSSRQRRMAGHEDHVLNASSWCLVDMTRDRPVVLEVPLQSSGVDKFTLRVTFFCSVINELTVAQSGPKDLTEPLLGYLKGYHGLHQLGLDHGIEAVKTVQADAQDALGIYTQASPASFAGLQVRLASIEVLTPATVEEERRQDEQRLKEHLRRQREMDLQRDLAKRQESYERSDRLEEQEYHRSLATEESQTTLLRLDLGGRERHVAREQERQEQDFQGELRHSKMADELRTAKMFGKETAEDPYTAVAYALARGDLDITELIRRRDEAESRMRDRELLERDRRDERLFAERDRDWTAEQEEARHRRQLQLNDQQLSAQAAERAAARERDHFQLEMEKESRQQQWEVTRDERSWERERDKLRLEHELSLAKQQLESGQSDLTVQREQERARREHELRLREQELAAIREERKWKDEQERLKWEREDRAHELDVNVEIAKSLLERGQGDQANLQDVVINVVRDVTNTRRGAAGPPPKQVADAEEPVALVKAEVVEDVPRMPEEEVG